MPEAAPGSRGFPILAASLTAILILAGGLIWVRPFLTNKSQPVAGVPAPAGLFSASELPVPAGGRACMNSVTVDAHTQVAQFGLRPAKATPRGGPPMMLVLTAPGYHATLSVPGGYPGGGVSLPIAAPKRSEIGTACFLNRGRTGMLLLGTTEPRSLSRTHVEVDGRGVVGDIALTFLEDRQVSYLSRLSEIFEHASDLTDGLLPVWLIYAIAVFVAFGVPVCLVLAFYSALSADELLE